MGLLCLPQDTVNTLSYLLGFFHFLFEYKIPLIECVPLVGQLGILCFPCLCGNGGLAVHHTFQIIFRRRKQDLLGFGQFLFPLVLEINIRLLDVLFQRGKPPLNGFQLAIFSGGSSLGGVVLCKRFVLCFSCKCDFVTKHRDI